MTHPETKIARLALLVLASLALVACGSSGSNGSGGGGLPLVFQVAPPGAGPDANTLQNAPPILINPAAPSPNVSLTPGVSSTVDLSQVFSDPDGDNVAFNVMSTDPSIVTASVNGCTLTFTAVGPGSAQVTVTAFDVPSGTASSCALSGTGGNQPPTANSPIADQMLTITSAPVSIDLTTVFSDPDGGTLTFSASSSGTGVATASVSGNTLTITPVAPGTVTVTVVATDDQNATEQDMATVIVNSASSGGGNQPPLAVNPIADQTLTVASAPVTIDLTAVFTDPEGGTLTFSASSSDTAVATATISGNTLTITQLAAGSATITVVATDAQGATAKDMAKVTVTNQPPTVSNPIADQTLAATAAPVTIDLTTIFSDPDGGALTFTASSSDTGVATATIIGNTLTITQVAAGSATVTVVAMDAEGATAQDVTAVTVSGPGQAIDYYYDDTKLYSYQHGASPASTEVDLIDPTFVPSPVYAGTIPDFHPVYVLYRSSAGTFWRASTTPGSQPALQQVSAFNPTQPICFVKRGQDLANPDNAPIVFALLASGQSCFDSARTLDYRVIRAGDSASTPAVVFPQADASSVGDTAIVQLLNPSDFSHAGWLVIQKDAQNNATLVHVPANPAGPLTPILTPPSGIDQFESLGNVGNGVVMLSVAGALYSYDVANSTLNNLNFTFHSSFASVRPRPNASASDPGGEFYFIEDNVNTDGGALYRTQSGGTQAPIKIDDRPNCNLSDFGVTLAVGASRVVWSCHSSMAGGATLRSVSKSATQPGAGVIALDTAQDANNQEFGFSTAASDQYVYYNVLTSVSVPNASDYFTVEAKRAALDGSGVTTTPQARWRNLALAGRGPAAIVYRLDGLQKISDPAGGNTLVAVSANSPTNEVTVGTVPTGATGIVFTVDNAGLVTINTDSCSECFSGDILYIDASVANSLERVTNTPTNSEFAVLGF